MDYEWECCLKCNEFYEDRDIKPLCPECMTKESVIEA